MANDNGLVLTAHPLDDVVNQLLSRFRGVVREEIDAHKTKQSEDDDLLTFDEARALLRCSRTTMHEYEKDGKLKGKGKRMGRRVFFKRSDIMKALGSTKSLAA